MYLLESILTLSILVSIEHSDCAIEERNRIYIENNNNINNRHSFTVRYANHYRRVQTRETSFEGQNLQNLQNLKNAIIIAKPESGSNYEMQDTQRSAFNSTNWFCLDTYLATHNRTSNTGNSGNRSRNNRSDCKCLMNIHCANDLNHLSLWFRCFDFDDPSWLESFIEILSNDRYVSDSLKVKPQQHCPHDMFGSSFMPHVWLEFVRASKHSLSYIYDLIIRLNSFSHITLTTIQLRNCSLESIPNDILKKSINLLTLNLTHNQLREFDASQYFSSDSKLINLDLSHNHLEKINLSTLLLLKNVSLSSNRLATIQKNNLPNNLLDQTTNTIYLDDNPWNCDDNLEWLVQQIYTISDKLKTPEPECYEPIKARMFTFSIWKSIQITKLCSECSCTLRDKYAKYGKRYVTVNCTGVGLTLMPTQLPKNTKIVDVSNNRIRTMSNIQNVKAWEQITNLYIQNNSLESLQGFDTLTSAALIDFSGNLITEISKFIVAKMNSTEKKPMKLDKIRMGNNPYSCDCYSLGSHEWIKSNHIKIADLNEVRCGDLRAELAKNETLILAIDEKFKNQPLIRLQKSQLCPASHISLGLYETLNILMSCAIVIILVKLTYDYLWQKRTGKLPRFFKLNV